MKQDITKQKIGAALLRILHAVSCWALCRYYKSIVSSDLPCNSQPLSLFPLSLPLVCFGKECMWVRVLGQLQRNSVPGKNIFIPFHMDGAWWACFNVPWVCGVVQLYSIFYYLMEKEVYFFMFWKKHETKLCVCGGDGAGGDAEKESPPEISPLPMIFISWMVWFCW